jgi:hypothetical protein
MQRDIQKYEEWLAQNAREGVVIENMIIERKLAELAAKNEKPIAADKSN